MRHARQPRSVRIIRSLYTQLAIIQYLSLAGFLICVASTLILFSLLAVLMWMLYSPF